MDASWVKRTWAGASQPGLLEVVPCEIPRHLEHQPLEALAFAVRVQVDALEAPRPHQRRAARVAGQSRLHLHLGRNVHRVEAKRSDTLPVHRHPMPNRLRVALDTRETNLQMRLLGYCPNAPNLRWRLLPVDCGILLQRHDLERNAEDLRDLLAELAILSHRVAGSAQPSADDLFAKQLRHERSEPDDVVGDGVAVPSLGQHPDADDAAHVPRAGRMEGPFELPRQRLEPFRVEVSTLPVPRPVGLPDGVERQTHPPVGVGFRFPAVGFAHHLGVHTDGAHVSVDVAQFVETRRRNPPPVRRLRRAIDR